MRVRKLRRLLAFAEQEIVLPDGPRAGRKFQGRWHPAMCLLLLELDSGQWRRAFFTGPNQDGKTLALTILILFLLFERNERVVFGVPSIDMAADKWQVDLLPVIRASRYEALLPISGAGSRGGTGSLAFHFRHGPVLRFMTAGGDDQSRAGFTSPNLAVTEADGFDVVGSSSREGDKFSQLERRTLAYADRARTYGECTVTTEQGRVWQEYTRGSQSRIAIRCQHCGDWVTPEREHLTGWQDAPDEQSAVAATRLACPACGALWTENERAASNADPRLVHRGQAVAPDGTVYGDLPATDTLGFRWTAVNSTLNPRRLSLVGGKEWKARRSTNEVLAETDLCQSEWVIPGKPAEADVNAFDDFAILRRTAKGTPRGVCPDGVDLVTIGCDVGKYLCHYAVVGWQRDGSPHVLAYDVVEVQSRTLAVEKAILLALTEWRDAVAVQGWQHGVDGKGLLPATMIFVDGRYETEAVLQFVRESGDGFFAAQGFGSTQQRAGTTWRRGGTKVVHRGEHYAQVELASGERVIEVDVDHWKSYVHQRIETPPGETGALSLFDPNVGVQVDPRRAALEHLTFAKHLTAERRVAEFVPGTGTVTRWKQVRDANHYLDAIMLACVAGHAAGIRLALDDRAVAPPIVARASTAPAVPAAATSAPRSFARRYEGQL